MAVPAIVPPHTDVESAGTIAEGIRNDVLALRIPHEGSDIADVKYVTVSAGVACARFDEEADHAELIYRTDDTLYRAKDAGRNWVVRDGA